MKVSTFNELISAVGSLSALEQDNRIVLAVGDNRITFRSSAQYGDATLSVDRTAQGTETRLPTLVIDFGKNYKLVEVKDEQC